MTFYYSMKQILRSPLKSILFLLLAGVSAFLIALGGNLWEINRTMLEEFEDIFTTVGTVEQRADHTSIMTYRRGGKSYEDVVSGVMGEKIPNSVMDFEGAGYILKARQRPSFGALVDQKVRGNPHDFQVVEASPVESGVADESFPMRVEKVVAGALKEGDIFYICDEYMEKPRSFEAGTTYIMMLSYAGFVHGSRVEDIAPEEYVPEYFAVNSVASHQYTLDGKRVYDAVAEAEDERAFDVVTEGFYETERGKRWLEMAKSQDYQFYTVPVTPTDGTLLLMPFYWKDAKISEGRDITEEEYAEGKNVCLISSELALLLRKGVGDTLPLPLYYAVYYTIPKEGNYLNSILNAQGEVYPVFDEQDYEIVGIYTTTPASRNGYDLSRHEVIIPWNAVPENSWADNIAGFYAMQGSNTSFQIPNGTIEDFMAAWEKEGVEGLEIKFYDNGYTQLKSGIESRRMMAVIFLVSGCVLAVMILCFFSDLFITGQQQRITVERLLGRSKKQCAASILTGFFVLAILGTAAGSAAGWMATGRALKAAESTTEFDTTFSNTVIEHAEVEEIDLSAITRKTGAGTAAAAGGGMLLAAVLIASGFMRQNLKKEILQILGELEE